MENRDTHSSEHGGTSGPVLRASYVAPKLVEYGNVSKLTEGANASAGDGSSGLMR